jgi:hypothetical protein
MPPVKRLTKGRFLRHPSLSEAHTAKELKGAAISSKPYQGLRLAVLGGFPLKRNLAEGLAALQTN